MFYRISGGREIVSKYDYNLRGFFCRIIVWFKKMKFMPYVSLTVNWLYKIQVLLKYTKPTTQYYFEKHFSQSNIVLKKNYILPFVITADNRIRMFQYKLLNLEQYHGLFAHLVTLKKKLHFIFFTTVLTYQIFGITFRYTLSRILPSHV